MGSQRKSIREIENHRESFGKVSVKQKEQDDQRNAKGNSKRNRRKFMGKAIGAPKENRRISVESQRKVRRKTMLKPNESLGDRKESESKPNGTPKGKKEIQRKSKGHPEQPRAARNTHKQ